MMRRTLTLGIALAFALSLGVTPHIPSEAFAAVKRAGPAAPAEPGNNRRRPATAPKQGTPLESRPKANPKAKAKARPIDHCIPQSACRCQWEVLDGKKQYVCTPIRIRR